MKNLLKTSFAVCTFAAVVAAQAQVVLTDRTISPLQIPANARPTANIPDRSTAPSPQAAPVGKPVDVYVNSYKVAFDLSKPISVEGRVMVPLRNVFEQMGATVVYNPATHKVTANRNGKHVEMWLRNRTAVVNGERKLMDAMPQVENGRVHVPLRFLAENLDSGVAYYRDLAAIYITPHATS